MRRLKLLNGLMYLTSERASDVVRADGAIFMHENIETVCFETFHLQNWNHASPTHRGDGGKTFTTGESPWLSGGRFIL